MLTCQELVELVTDYVEGALPSDRHREVHDHLLECADCLRYLGQVQLTSRLLAKLSVSDLTDELAAKIRQGFRSATEQSDPGR